MYRQPILFPKLINILFMRCSSCTPQITNYLTFHILMMWKFISFNLFLSFRFPFLILRFEVLLSIWEYPQHKMNNFFIPGGGKQGAHFTLLVCAVFSNYHNVGVLKEKERHKFSNILLYSVNGNQYGVCIRWWNFFYRYNNLVVIIREGYPVALSHPSGSPGDPKDPIYDCHENSGGVNPITLASIRVWVGPDIDLNDNTNIVWHYKDMDALKVEG